MEYFENDLHGKEFSIITDHRALLSILNKHRSNKSYNSCLSQWVDRLLSHQFKIEQLPGAKMGIVDYISRNPYQPAKSIPTYDDEFIVATLSRIQTDAKLLQKEKHISVVTPYDFYHDNKPVIQTSSTTHTNEVLNINSVKPKLLKKDTMSHAPPSLSPDLPIKTNHKIISDPATRVRLIQNNPTLATRKHHSIIPPSNNIKSDSEHAMRVRLIQSKLIFAKRKSNKTSFTLIVQNLIAHPHR